MLELPVYITTRDRLTCLLQLIEWLERAEGVRDITMVDNDSTYPPLIEFLETTRHRVIRLKSNLGGTAPIKCGAVPQDQCPYLLTDPDIIPDENCPMDAIGFLLDKYIATRAPRPQVGISLRIDDLPDHFCGKAQVLMWEAQHWARLRPDGWFDANVDTTFAVYAAPRPARPNIFSGGWRIVRVRAQGSYGLRSPPPYQARHQPWYLNTSSLPEDEQYYLDRLDPKLAHWHRVARGYDYRIEHGHPGEACANGK